MLSVAPDRGTGTQHTKPSRVGLMFYLTLTILKFFQIHNFVSKLPSIRNFARQLYVLFEGENLVPEPPVQVQTGQERKGEHQRLRC